MAKIFAIFSLIGLVLLLGSVSGSSFAFAQSVPALTCSPATQTVNVGQSATFTASGGAGGYTWYAPDVSLTNPTGSGFVVTYNTPGTRIITVNAAGLSANCTLNVVSPGGSTTGGTLACSPATQSATVGQSATFTATGGTGSYVWSAPELTLVNPTGSGFTVNYATTGTKTITVTSGNQSAVCTLAVSAGTTPGLPNTGGGAARFLKNFIYHLFGF